MYVCICNATHNPNRNPNSYPTRNVHATPNRNLNSNRNRNRNPCPTSTITLVLLAPSPSSVSTITLSWVTMAAPPPCHISHSSRAGATNIVPGTTAHPTMRSRTTALHATILTITLRMYHSPCRCSDRPTRCGAVCENIQCIPWTKAFCIDVTAY